MESLEILDALTEALGVSEVQAARKEISANAKYPEHNTDSSACWCDPEIVEYADGSKLIIHNDFN